MICHIFLLLFFLTAQTKVQASQTYSAPLFVVLPEKIYYVNIGDTLALTCVAEGSPAPGIIWFRHDSPVQEPSRMTIDNDGTELRINNIRPDDLGDYSCVARNAEGRVHHTTKVAIQGEVIITESPESTVTFEGEAVNFKCKGEGSGNLTTNWLKGDAPIESIAGLSDRTQVTKDGNLIIAQVESEDGGIYFCEISNGIGRSQKVEVTLDVEYPARVPFTPAIQGLTLQSPGVIRCHIESNPSFTFVTWTKNKRIFDPFEIEGIRSSNNGSLYINKVTKANAGLYTCTPYNKHGTTGTSGVMQVFVNEPNVIQVTAEEHSIHNIMEGDMITFSCEGKETTGNISVRWAKGDKHVSSVQGLSNRVHVTKDGNLTISQVKAEDGGEYFCEISNENSQSQKASTSLIVDYPARIIFSPAKQYLPLHLSGVINCHFESSPEFHFVTWTKDKRIFDPFEMEGMTSLNNGSLLIAKVTKAHAGDYTCTPYNTLGSTGTSGIMQVFVRDPKYLKTSADIEKDILNDFITIPTYLGDITGHRKGTYNQFLGIPYAKPPIGALRFMPPEPVEEYHNLQATQYGSKCVQMDWLGKTFGTPVGDEDCLFLDIYAPVAKSDNNTLKAVMVWIHGGGFHSGSGQEYIPLAFMKEDVIVVLINYRLGAFGFSSFGNNLVSGNMGLKDQIEALKWVKQHIRHFGGDPSRVTIFGESAGGISVTALYVSPLAKGLFSAAIAQSGTMLMLREVAEVSQNWRTTQAVAENFNCSNEYGPGDEYDMLACLQAVSAFDFLNATQVNFYPTTSDNFHGRQYYPSSDYFSRNPVLPSDSFKRLTLGQFNHVPLMSGTIKNDGAIFAMISGPFNRFSAAHLHIAGSRNLSEITQTEQMEADIIHKFYTDRASNFSMNSDGFNEMFTDLMFQSPDQKMAETVSKHVDVYNYLFTYRSENSLSQLFGLPDKTYAPVHADQLIFEFSSAEAHINKLFPGGYRLSRQDEKMTEVMIKYFTQFAKTGNPSAQGLPAWNKFGEEKNYLELKPDPEMKSNLNPTRQQFMQNMLWNKREADIYKSLLPSYITDCPLCRHNGYDY